MNKECTNNRDRVMMILAAIAVVAGLALATIGATACTPMSQYESDRILMNYDLYRLRSSSCNHR